MFSCRRVHCLSVPLILVLFVWGWLLPGATELQAAGARNDWDAYVQDSLLTLAADANFPAEPTIQDILDNLGYALNAETDALELDLFCLFPQSQWTLIAEYSGAADTHELGWYVPLTPGDSATVITGAMIPGDEVTLTGTESGNQGIFHRRDSGTAWFTEQALNYDGIVHHKAYPLPDGDGYIIFWEDLGWVTDADYNDMVVEVRPQNQAPFISVGFAKACSVCPPEYICEGDSVCLEIQVSDPGCFGDTVTLEMIEGDGTFVPVTGVAPYTAIHCWVPIWAGTKYFVFRATDNLGLTDEKEFWANVAFDHDPPVLPPPATLDVTACLPTEICVDFPIEDDSYTGLWIEPIGWYDDLLQRVCFDADTAGSYELSVIAADTCGNADTTLLTVNVTTTSPPVVTAGPDVEVELCGPDSLCVEFSVFDPDFDVVSITTDAPGIINLSDSTLCYVADGPGTVELPIYVLDACGYADTAWVTFTVTSGSPLSLECPPSVETLLCEGGMVCFPITFTGGTGEVIVTVAPDGYYNIETGEVCFPVGGAGDYDVTVTVTDDCGSDECVVPLSVTMNTPPEVDLVYDPPTLVCEEIDTVCVQFTCSDIDDNLTSCEVIAAPPGYWIQDNSVCFEVTEDGISTVTVEATDACGATDINTVEIESHFNSAPEITVEESIDIGLCGPDEVCFPVEIADVDGNLQSVIVTGGVYDDVNGEVCFSADQDGDYVITITAVDECQVETVRTVTVSVTLSVPVEITCPDPYEGLLCAPGPVCLPFVLPAFNGGLQVTVEPIGTYDDINEQICFDADTSGVYLLTVIAADTCGGADTCTVTATININDLPDVVAESGASFDLCMPEEICFPVSCTDPDDNLISCELISGPGTYNGAEICFTPTESGRVNFVVRATDECGADREVQTYVDVTINDRPTITAPTVITAFLCEPDFICVNYSASDPEGGPVTVTSSIGEVDDSTLCVYFDADTDVCAELIATDTCGNADTATVCFEVDLNDKPVVTVDDAFDFALCAPGPICFPVEIVEEYIRTTLVSPIGVYDDGVVCFDADTSGVYEFRIIVMDTCLVSDTATTTVTVEVNSPPVLTVPGETEVFTCSLDDQVCVTGITVDDAEGNLDTVELTGGVGIFNLSAGELCFDPDTVGYYCFELTAADDCGAVNVEAFCVQVTLGEAPVIALEPTINVVLPAPGNVCFDVGSDDPDLDQLFDLELLAGIGSFPTIDGRNTIAAEHCFAADTAGYYSFIFSSTDSCGLFDIESTVVLVDIVPPDTSFRICIDTLEAMNGRNIDVNVVVYESMVMGGFDLLICFDHTVLAFNHVVPGPAIEEWEYFTYRATSPDGCVGTCDVTAIRLFAIADMNDGASHPSEEAFTPVGIIATMNFYVTEDRSFIGQCAPFTFCSYDCGDNTVSSRTGDTLYVSYDGVDPACLEGMKFDPISAIDFCDGLLCIVPPPDDRGDINLNGIANEVADAVLFTNYFIFGPSVWDPLYYENQWLATDVNDDGSTKTVADLVYLIRIITGDAEPFPRSGEGGRLSINDVVSLETRYDNGELILTSDSPVEVGGLFVRLEGAVGSLGEPRYGDDVVELTPRYRVGDDESRLLIAPMKLGAAIPAGRVELARFAVTAPNAVKIAEADAADYQGYPLAVTLASGAPGVPQLFELAQNYPNPFNATTVIRLSIPSASDYTLSIYDVTGRKVREFSGRSEPGIVQIMWDGADEQGNPVASGIYLYRATAGEQHSTRKMVLVK